MIFIPDSDTQAGREGDHGQEDDAELGVGLEGGEHAEQTAPLRASHNCLSSSLQRLLPSPRPPPLSPLPGCPPQVLVLPDSTTSQAATSEEEAEDTRSDEVRPGWRRLDNLRLDHWCPPSPHLSSTDLYSYN